MKINRATPLFCGIIISMFTLFAGCASFSPEELANLNYGPLPENYKSIIQERLNSRLKDPISAVVEYRGGPTQVTQKGSMLTAKDYGWGICLWVNAKNSFGAYVGRRPYAYIIRDEMIVQQHGEMETNMFDTAITEALCTRIGTH